MREFAILMSPMLWSLKNDIRHLKRSFYRKAFFYAISSGLFLILFTKLINIGMTKLQNMSSNVFDLLLIKGYSFIFVIIFFIQIVNGFIISLTVFFQARDMEVLFVSPVSRTALFFSRILEVHIKASWMLVIFGMPLLFASGVLFRAAVFYYSSVVILFVVFSIISVNIGAALALFLSNLFHVRRMKRVLFSSGVVAAASLVMLLRVFRPERFVNPELFANLTFFITDMKAPSFILLPTRWLSESVFALLGKSSGGEALAFAGLLFLTAYITLLFLLRVFKRYHYRGWSLLQEGDFIDRGQRYSGLSKLRRKESAVKVKIEQLLFLSRKKSCALMGKDFLYQMRDVRNLHQILILASLIAVYVFSILSLPLNWVGYEVQLKFIFSFLNLGLILIILASLCSRLVYPAVLSEVTFLWIMRTSPVTARRFVLTKFFFFFVPIFLVGQLLVISSSLIIGIECSVIILKGVTAALVTFSLLGLALFFGTSDMKRAGSGTYQTTNVTENMGYLLGAVFLILFTLAMEIAPVYLYFLKESGQGAFVRKAWAIIGGITFLLFCMHLIITFFSLLLSVKKIEKYEA